MENLSAIIVVKDNPKTLEKTIKSIYDLVKEIIIVDIGIDSLLTKKLEKNKKIKIIKIEKDIPYVELIREETKKYAKTDYVLFLDPDEEISENLKKTIQENYQKYDFIKIPRKNIIFGKWIAHSRWWPDYQIRVFKKDKVVWSKILHNQPAFHGKGLTISPQENLAIIHYNYQNIDQYFQKFIRYAKSEAKYLLENKKPLTFQETVKKSISEFFSRYFAFQGYKDGIYGFILAFLQMIYYFFVYFYYLEEKKFEANEKIAPDIFFIEGTKNSFFWKNKKSLKEKIMLKIFKIFNL
ncbi:MAG: glycosyltransferase family 2 protein [Patescibacteria group bacterium]|nr:glycosyltransferase family 2 protein [Patescibacteria group bacterium]